jgi:phosphate uptake regulator
VATRYEVKMYADITRAAKALERIADALEAIAPPQRRAQKRPDTTSRPDEQDVADKPS